MFIDKNFMGLLLDADLLEGNAGMATLTLTTILSKVHVVAHMTGTTFGCKFHFTRRTLVAGIAFQF